MGVLIYASLLIMRYAITFICLNNRTNCMNIDHSKQEYMNGRGNHSKPITNSPNKSDRVIRIEERN